MAEHDPLAQGVSDGLDGFLCGLLAEKATMGEVPRLERELGNGEIMLGLRQPA